METFLLHSAHLTLRNLRESDFDAVFAYRSDAWLCRFIGDPMTAEEVAAHIARNKQGWSRQEGETLNLAVELRSTGELVGEAMMRYLSAKQRQAEIGLALHPRYQGRRLGPEACLDMFRYCFEELGAHRVVGFIDAENEPSLRMSSAIGMLREGLLRQNMFRQGAWRDEHLMSVLEGEWPELKRRYEHLLVPSR